MGLYCFLRLWYFYDKEPHLDLLTHYNDMRSVWADKHCYLKLLKTDYVTANY